MRLKEKSELEIPHVGLLFNYTRTTIAKRKTRLAVAVAVIGVGVVVGVPLDE